MGVLKPGTRTIGDGRHADEYFIQLSGIAASFTTTADSDVLEIDKGTLCLDLTVGGTPTGTNPTLDVTIQTSKDKVTWRTLITFTQATAAGTERKSAGGFDRFVKAVLTIGGTASPTFPGVSISGDAK